MSQHSKPWRGLLAGSSRKLAILTVVFCAVTLLPHGASALSSPTIYTDKLDYVPDQVVTVTGSGFDPSTSYDIPVIRPDGTIVQGDGSLKPGWDSVMTDANGDLTYHYQLDGITGLYEIRVYASPWSGNQSEAPITSTTFHDATSANLDGCANGDPTVVATACTTAASWTNGDLGPNGSNASQYFEGDSVPFRVDMSGESAGSHTVHINYDTTISGKHAFDYLTSFDRTMTAADPCAGISPCSGPPSTFTIPTDPNVTGGGVTPVAGVFSAYNATITAASAYTLTGTYAGSSTTDITLTWTPTDITKDSIIAWGAHIASRNDWGRGSSAASINGSSYHIATSAIDGTTAQAAHQLKSSAIILFGAITIIKDAVPNSPQTFDYSTTGGLSPSTFSLVDNGTPGTNTTSYTNLKNFTTYTFSETAVSGWTTSFGSPPCTVTDANGGTQSATGQTLTVNLAEGEAVTCTFTNTKNASLTITKSSVGGTGSFSFSGTGGTSGVDASFAIDTSTTNPNSKSFPLDGTQVGSAKTVAETVPSGWVLTSIACSGGGSSVGFAPTSAGPFHATFAVGDKAVQITVGAGEAPTCTFTNTKNGSLTVTKSSVGGTGSFSFSGTGGTSGVDASFAIDTSTTNPNSKTFALDGTQVGSAKTVTETVPSGWTLTNIACSGGGSNIQYATGAGGTFSSTFAVGNDTVRITVGAGETPTCTFTNSKTGSLTITKNSVGGTGSFSFSGTGGTSGVDASFSIDTSTTDPNSKSFSLDGTQVGSAKTVTETVPSGWTLTSIACSGGGSSIGFATTSAGPFHATFAVGDKAVQITVGAGENPTCTFTNTKNASLTITKSSVGGTGSFSYAGPGGTSGVDASFSIDTTTTNPNSKSFTLDGTQVGSSKAVMENVPSGWTLTSIVCSGGGSSIQFADSSVGTFHSTFAVGDDTVRITVGAGETPTCTFTNTKNGSLTIAKHSVGGTGSFSFSGDGGTSGVDASFSIDTTGTNPNPKSFPLNGTQVGSAKVVTETIPSGWTLTSIACSGGGSNVGFATTSAGPFHATLAVGDTSVRITVSAGETPTCTFTNTKNGSLTIAKSSVGGTASFSFAGDGGTSGVDASFSIDTSTTNPNSKSFPLNGTQVGSAKTVTEAVPSGWTLTSVVCSGGGSSIGFATTSAGPFHATFAVGDTSVQITVSAGETPTCTFTNTKNGSLTITKSSVGGTGSFSFTGDGGTSGIDASFAIDTTGTNPNSKAFPLDGTQVGSVKTVTETVPAGWSLTGISCSGGSNVGFATTSAGPFHATYALGDKSVQITVSAGDNPSCTFTNTKHATVVIDKIVAGPGGTFDYTSTDGLPSPANGSGDFSIDATAGTGSATFSDVLPLGVGTSGTYTVTEVQPASTTLTGLDCVDGNTGGTASTTDIANKTVTINADPGETVTCTFNNTRNAFLTIVKSADPADDTPFSFTTPSGTTGPTAFTSGFSLKDPTSPSQQFEFDGNQLGSKSVTETAVSGWALTDLTCTGASSTDLPTRTASVTLAAGDVASCTFTNKKNATVTIKKTAQPADGTPFGFGGDFGSFTLQDPAGANPNQVTYTVTGLAGDPDFGSKTVTENVPALWAISDITCTGVKASVALPSTTFTVSPGDTIECTFTNQKDASVTIIKNAIPDDDQLFDYTGGLGSFQLQDNGDELDGHKSSETFPFSADPATGAAFGTNTVSETPVTGWDLTDLQCSKGTTDIPTLSATFDVQPGDAIMCTFENTKRASIVVDKNEFVTDASNNVTVQPTTNKFTFDLTGPNSFSQSLTTNDGVNGASLLFDDNGAGLVPGTYTLCEEVPDHYSSSLGATDPITHKACVTLTLSAGEKNTTYSGSNAIQNNPCADGALTIHVTQPPGSNESQSFTFDVTGPGGFSAGGLKITFAPGEFDSDLSGLNIVLPVTHAGTYTVTQEAGTWGSGTVAYPSATSPALPIALGNGCANDATFTPSYAPPAVEVFEQTDPPGYEGSGWEFTLEKNGVPVEPAVATTGTSGMFFTTQLTPGNYTVTQTTQLPGWTETAGTLTGGPLSVRIGAAVKVCSFTVNLPRHAGGIFQCTFANKTAAQVTVIKTEQLSGAPHPAQGHWKFSLTGGNAAKTVGFSLKMNTAGRRNRINFGKSVPIGNYTLCENPFGKWRSSLLSMPGGFKNAKGQSCVNFSVAAGQHKIIIVNNQCTASAKASERRLP